MAARRQAGDFLRCLFFDGDRRDIEPEPCRALERQQWKPPVPGNQPVSHLFDDAAFGSADEGDQFLDLGQRRNLGAYAVDGL